MTKKDMEDLWRLLAKLRPNDPHLEDKGLMEAWLIVLRPYKPSDVGKAVGAYFREKRFWPDPTEIAKMCPGIPGGDASARRWPGWSAYGYRDEGDYLGQTRALVETGRLMDRDYLAAGLPHPSDARRRGWTVEGWNERCRAATGGDGDG